MEDPRQKSIEKQVYVKCATEIFIALLSQDTWTIGAKETMTRAIELVEQAKNNNWEK